MHFDSSTSMWIQDKSELCAISDTLVLTSATLSVVLRVSILSQLTSRLSVANCEGQLHDREWVLWGASAADKCMSTWACFEMCIADNQLNSEERV